MDKEEDVCGVCKGYYGEERINNVRLRHKHFHKKIKAKKELLRLDLKIDAMKKKALKLGNKIQHLEQKKFELLKIKKLPEG